MVRALGRITADLPEQLDAKLIEQACHDAGHRWGRRIVDPVATMHLLLRQVLHWNTACSHLPHLFGRTFSASAYGQARRRIWARSPRRDGGVYSPAACTHANSTTARFASRLALAVATCWLLLS